LKRGLFGKDADDEAADTAARWISANEEEYENEVPSASRQHFDVGQFQEANGSMSVWRPTIKQLEKIAELEHARLPAYRIAEAFGIFELDLVAWLKKVPSAKEQEAP
jgi:hypothetical protein